MAGGDEFACLQARPWSTLILSEIKKGIRKRGDLKTLIIFRSRKSRKSRRILNPDMFMTLPSSSADVTQNIHERGGRMGRMGDRRKDGEGGKQE